MKKLTGMAVALLLGVCGFLMVQAQGEVPEDVTLEVHPADAKPKWDMPAFKASGVSIARADLLACRNSGVKPSDPQDATIEEFSRALNGVWINNGGRTIHGKPSETEMAFYIQMDGATGVGLLLDRSNLGTGILSAPFMKQGPLGLAGKRLVHGASMVQLNCTYEFRDEYLKVSDDVSLRALAQTTPVKYHSGLDLVEAWEQLVDAGYFATMDMPIDAAGNRTQVSAILGDGKRVAVLPEGLVVNEKEIQTGRFPGAEHELPTLTGGLFRISLLEIPAGDGRPAQAVRMTWEGQYRGVGLGIPPNEEIYGIESGEFIREGNAFVSARGMYDEGTKPVLDLALAASTTETSLEDESWITSSCPDKLATETSSFSVSNETAKLHLAGDTVREVEVHPELYFERFVIGLPGGPELGQVKRLSR